MYKNNGNRLLFIYNPNAGRGVVKNHISGIIETFCSHGYEVSVYATSEKGDASSCVKQRGMEFDRIVCCGGDGTLNEVTDGLMVLDSVPPCGYIPAGTVNDFAHSFNLPKDMNEAAEIAVTGIPVLCDIGEINGDYLIMLRHSERLLMCRMRLIRQQKIYLASLRICLRVRNVFVKLGNTILQ